MKSYVFKQHMTDNGVFHTGPAVHTEGSAQARLSLSRGFSELSSESSQCEMPQCETGHET